MNREELLAIVLVLVIVIVVIVVVLVIVLTTVLAIVLRRKRSRITVCLVERVGMNIKCLRGFRTGPCLAFWVITVVEVKQFQYRKWESPQLIKNC